MRPDRRYQRLPGGLWGRPVWEQRFAGIFALAAWSLVHGLAALYVDGQLTAKEFTSTDASSLADLVTKQLYLGLRLS